MVISGTTATVAVPVRAAAGWGRPARRAVLAGAGAGTFTLAWALRAVAGELVNVPVSRPRRADRCLKPTEFPWGAAARYAR